MPKHLTFEQHLKIMQDHQQARGNIRQSLIDVADNCHLGLAWFLDHDIEPTAADLLTFARMVLDREAQLDRRDDDELGALADDDT